MVAGGSRKGEKTRVGENIVSVTFKVSTTHGTVSKSTCVNRQMQILPAEKFCSN